jgi:hypothetical protein
MIGPALIVEEVQEHEQEQLELTRQSPGTFY